jgi:2OG-Fe(II) oxygenase superfamily
MSAHATVSDRVIARTAPGRGAIAVRLEPIAEEFGPLYRAAEPFPHIVLDGVFRDDVLDAVLDEWPGPADVRWIKYDDDPREFGKRTSSHVGRFGPTTRQLLAEISSPFFLEFLGLLTGISGLLPDPYFASAGLFEVVDGGYLDIHGDFTINQRTGLDRRCNVLVYLNHGWTDSNGGQLELWRARPLRRERSIVPLFNRMVIFDTMPNAYHGHPNPVVAPMGGNRKAISAYYFTRGRPFREQFYGAQGVLAPGAARSRQAQLRAVGKAVTPPILLEAAKHVQRKMKGRGHPRFRSQMLPQSPVR